VVFLGMDTNSILRFAGSCARQNYHPIYIQSSLAANNALLGNRDIEGFFTASQVFPFMVDNTPATAQFHQAAQQYDPSLQLSVASAVAWSAGKQAFAQTGKGGEKSGERMLEAPSTVGGLAFAPKGFRLAIAHYNGATLWFPNAQSEPERLEWKGSHLGASMSPDGKFLVTSMQEPMLHGWRLADGKDMRMSGYGARVRSLDWTVGGKWLATSGSTQLILWPFQGKDGPMGKTPRILAPTEAQAEVVACHPKQDVVAVGYADGLVLLVRIDDGAEVLAHKPGGAPVTALAWSASGDTLAFGIEDGEAGVIDLR